MRTIFLAAGYATRLYPLTKDFPKPLLKVAGKPILDHLLDDLKGCGAWGDPVVVTNHRFADIFRNWAPEGVSVVDDGTTTNEGRLGAVRDLLLALETLSIDDDILVLAGDNLLDFSLSAFIRYASEKETSCVMRLHVDDLERLRKCGVMEVDPDDRILSMEEKPAVPKSNWACPPFYYYVRNDVARIGEAVASGCGTDAPGSLAAWFAANGVVHAMEMPGMRYDIGTVESYRTVCRIFENLAK